MIFFQTWIGQSISNVRLDHILSVNRCIADSDSHVIATDAPALFSCFDCKTIDIHGFIKSRIEFLPSDRQKYFSEITYTAMEKTNFARMAMAAEVPDLFYLDTDIFLHNRPRFEAQWKPYFAKEAQRINIFYVNGRTDIFDGMLYDWPPADRPDFYNRFRRLPDISIMPPCYDHNHLRSVE